MSAAVDPFAPERVDDAAIDRVIDVMLREDLEYGPDVTTQATVAPARRCTAVLRTRQAGVICGLDFARRVLERVCGGQLSWQPHVRDGDHVAEGTPVCSIEAAVQPLLTAERTMLNLLTHLSGVASLTAAWVDAVSGTGTRIRDTRKTLPGIRALQKYAVRCGGGVNHRMGLGDAALIKDNHIAAAGGIVAAISAVRERAPQIELEVECDDLSQVREALQAGATFILLDNMSLDQLREAVTTARQFGGVQLEASGGLSLENARAVAETGVDYLAVGALTHSVPALDIGLDTEN